MSARKTTKRTVPLEVFLQTADSSASPNSSRNEVCRFFSEKGYCKYGTNCKFAHLQTSNRRDTDLSSVNPSTRIQKERGTVIEASSMSYKIRCSGSGKIVSYQNTNAEQLRVGDEVEFEVRSNSAVNVKLLGGVSFMENVNHKAADTAKTEQITAPTTSAPAGSSKPSLAPTWKLRQKNSTTTSHVQEAAPTNGSHDKKQESIKPINSRPLSATHKNKSSEKRDRGVVRSIKDGYGFIKCTTADYSSLFFTTHQVEGDTTLRPGDLVEFVIRPDPKNPSAKIAVNVSLVRINEFDDTDAPDTALELVVDGASSLNNSPMSTSRGKEEEHTRFPNKAAMMRWIESTILYYSLVRLLKIRQRIGTGFDGKDPAAILLHRDALEDLLNRTELPFSVIEPLVRLLVNDSIRQHIGADGIYKLVVQSNFIRNPRNLRSYILRISNSSQVTNKLVKDASDVISLVEELLDRFPDARAVLPLEILEACAERMRTTFPPAVCDAIRALLAQERVARTRKTQQMIKDTDLQDQDFREMSIFPSADEILAPDAELQSRVRKNIISGKYSSVMHYLDTHFRLLREDAITSIRDGIKAIKQNEPTQELYVYTDVKMRGISTSSIGIMYRVEFRVDCNVHWERTKRLMFGSLLCLSADNFNTLLWATVASRDADLLSTKRQVDIRFTDGFNEKFDPMGTYTMVESSSTYFEAYQHVLLALQNLQLESFPFLDYLINCESVVRPPQYLVSNDCYNMTGVLDDGPPVFSLLKPWPNDIQTTMDNSQLEALKQALTKEFAIIQGPPGTGKTYVGLKVMRALLDNRNMRTRAPILVICYTNHALDQFLEGVLQFESNIVRIGSRSKSESLKEKNIKKLVMQSNRMGKEQLRERKALNNQLKQLQDQLQNVFEELTKAVLSKEDIASVANEDQVESLFRSSQPEDINETAALLESWLGCRPKDVIANQNSLLSEAQSDKQPSKLGSQKSDRLFGDFGRVDDDADDVYDVEDIELLQMERMVGEDEDQKIQSKELSEPILSVTGLFEHLKGTIDVWTLSRKDRQRLYLLWLNEYRQRLLRDGLAVLCESFERCTKEKNAIEMELQLQVLSEAAVIGMTTTGVAKFQSLIQKARPEIIIVEEAAEVLEAHILAALSSATKHLILIGDHEQLRPSTAVYRLAKKYHLDVSLFERMVRNNVEHKTLLRQRRMRPQISSLITPIYPNLYNHPDVESYPHVKGVSCDLFFVDHDHQEANDFDSGISKSNKHESAFIARLCQYLLLQGYKNKQITVLTAYAGQVKLIRSDLRLLNINGVYVTSVDNFQGEENDIILLSLVRSNNSGIIGFLSTSNRICVALSRARIGFYIIGNASLLSARNETWAKIIAIFRNQKAIGPALKLQCQKHTHKFTFVSCDADFKNVEDGGCDKPCGEILDCGHKCPRLCHPYSHAEVLCHQPCTKTHAKCGHKCTRRCFEDCGECEVQVPYQFPCGHSELVPCFTFDEEHKCKAKCERLLPCGHACPLPCGFECSKKCKETVLVALPCNHQVQVECSADRSKLKCLQAECLMVPLTPSPLPPL